MGHRTLNLVSVHFVHEIHFKLSHSLNNPPFPKFQSPVCASTLSLGLHDTDFHFSLRPKNMD